MTESVLLDRKRTFGTVYGDSNIGYVQDEKYFRPDGKLYVPPVAPTATPKPVEPVADPLLEERKAAQSETMKRVWAERREALAQQRIAEAQSPSAPDA